MYSQAQHFVGTEGKGLWGLFPPVTLMKGSMEPSVALGFVIIGGALRAMKDALRAKKDALRTIKDALRA